MFSHIRTFAGKFLKKKTVKQFIALLAVCGLLMCAQPMSAQNKPAQDTTEITLKADSVADTAAVAEAMLRTPKKKVACTRF